MKKLIAVLFLIAFTTVAFGACKSPCDKLYGKLMDCIPKGKKPSKKAMADAKKAFIEECKKDKDKAKKAWDKCGSKSCKDFDKCMEGIK